MSTTIASASIKISPDLDDFRAELEAEVRSSIAGANAKVRVEADTDEADAKLDETDLKLDKLGHKRVTAEVSVKTDGSKEAETEVSGILTAVVALGPALVPIGAAVIGFGGASIAALGSVALGAGVVALAFDAIKKEVTTDLTPALGELKKTAADGILPGVKEDIQDLLPELPKVNALVGSLSTEIGHLAGEAGQGLDSSGFKSFFNYIDSSAGPILDEFGHSVGNVAEGSAKLAVGFAPVTAEIGQGLESLTGRFAGFSTSSAGFQHFIAYVEAEGPQVGQTLEAIGGAVEHGLEALAPLGHEVLDVVKGLSEFAEVTPTPFLTAFFTVLAVGVVGFKAYTLETKLATAYTKLFGEEADTAAITIGSLAAVLAAVAVGFTEYSAAKAANAATDASAAASGAAYVATLKVNYTSTKSLADVQDDLRSKIAAVTAEFNGLKAAGVDVGGVLHPLQIEIQSLGAQLHLTATQGKEAQGNAENLGAQYGLTTAQVVKLVGGSKELVGSSATVSARFKTLFEAAESTHQPLSEAAIDIKTLGDKASTASQDISALSDELNIFAGNALATDAAALTFKDDVATLEAALKTSKGSFDSNTTAGWASAEALNAAATQALALANASEKSGGSVEKTRKILGDAITTLDQTAGHSKAARAQIDLLKQAYDHIPDSSKAAAAGTATDGGQIAKNARQAAGDAGASLKTSIPLALKAGQDFSSAYAQGIADGNNAAANAAAKITATAIQTVKDTQQSSSPAKVLIKEGHNASTGYAQGIVSGIPEATKAAADLATKSAKSAADAAKAAAKSEASKVTSIDDFLGLTFNTDATGTAKQVDSGIRQLIDDINKLSLTGSAKKGLDSELELARKGLVNVADASKNVTTGLKDATSALQTLKSDAANVRSSTLSSFQGLGDPSQFNSITSLAGVNSVLGKSDVLAEAFDKSLAKARKDGLNKAAYGELVAGGPGQDSQIAALLATATKAQIRQFDREESLLTSTGTSAGNSSASYLYGHQIAEQTKTVKELRVELQGLRHDQRELAKDAEKVTRSGIRGAHADAVALVHAEQRVGRDVAQGLDRLAAARKQTHRAKVAGARG